MTTPSSSCTSFLHAPSNWRRPYHRCIRTAVVHGAGSTGMRTRPFPFGSRNARGLRWPMASCNDFGSCPDRGSSYLNSGAPRRNVGGLDVLIHLCHTLRRSDFDGCLLPRCPRPAPTRLPHIHSLVGRDNRTDSVRVRKAVDGVTQERGIHFARARVWVTGLMRRE